VQKRLLLEEEVVAAARVRWSFEAVEKFVQEVYWRSYWKGWLEHRPEAWSRWVEAVPRLRDALSAEQGTTLEAALAGRTGIAGFDDWARELVATGYLHNHARMWFASIWIFTLRLPWRLGADFFLRHLLDGDPASNTLGWRWVAGLHTRGKAYRARADNIATFTAGRFTPRADQLDAGEAGLEATEPEGLPPILGLRPVVAPRPDLPTALLITDEDCCVEDFPWSSLDVRAAATLTASALRSPRTVAESVARFEADALADATARLRQAGIGVSVGSLNAVQPESLVDWAVAHGVRQIVTPYVAVGPLRDWLDAAAPALAAEGVVLAEWRRPWDEAVWPHATAGFFKVKQRIPQLLRLSLAH